MLTLTIDSEARQLARRARDDRRGDRRRDRQRHAAAAALRERLQRRMDPRRRRRAGDVPLRPVARTCCGCCGASSARRRVDAALLAVDAADAALAKPYVGTIPSYTSSQVNERQSREALRDLDDVRFVDIPWLVDAGRRARSPDLKRPDYPESRARAPLRARHGRVPRRAGVRRRHAREARVRRRDRPSFARRHAPVRPRGTADAVPRRPQSFPPVAR